MNATSQKALIMSEEEMRAFAEYWPTARIIGNMATIHSLDNLYERTEIELKRESGSTL